MMNSETRPHEKTYKEKYAEKEAAREQALGIYLDRLKNEFRPGDVIYFKRYDDEECGVLYKDIYTEREYGELYIKIPVVRIAYYIISDTIVSNCASTYSIFHTDDYEIRRATTEDIVRYSRKYIRDEIDDRRDIIIDEKRKMRSLKRAYNSLNEHSATDTVQKIISEIVR